MSGHKKEQMNGCTHVDADALKPALMDKIAPALQQPIYIANVDHCDMTPTVTTCIKTPDNDQAALLVPQNSMLVTVNVQSEHVIFWIQSQTTYSTTSKPVAYIAHPSYNTLTQIFPPSTILRAFLMCNTDPNSASNTPELALFDVLKIGSQPCKQMSVLERHVRLRTLLHVDGSGCSHELPNCIRIHWVGYVAACKNLQHLPWPVLGVGIVTDTGLSMVAETAQSCSSGDKHNDI